VDPALRAYKPALELWADGATKQRFISIPAGIKIDTSSFDEWVFPNGTKVWKEFRLDGKRVETRLYEKGTDARCPPCAAGRPGVPTRSWLSIASIDRPDGEKWPSGAPSRPRER